MHSHKYENEAVFLIVLSIEVPTDRRPPRDHAPSPRRRHPRPSPSEEDNIQLGIAPLGQAAQPKGGKVMQTPLESNTSHSFARCSCLRPERDKWLGKIETGLGCGSSSSSMT